MYNINTNSNALSNKYSSTRYPPTTGVAQHPLASTEAKLFHQTKSRTITKAPISSSGLSNLPLSTTSSTEYVEERETYISETGEKKSRLLRRYIKGRLLGRGGFAQCYEFTSVASGNTYAAKIVEKKSLKEKTKQKLISEIKIHKSLDHKNIVRFERYFEDRKNVYILLEVCNGKSLTELMKKKKRLTEAEARFFMYQIFQALSHLHKHKIIHRDLKLGNLFLTEELEVKTGDFGLAAQLDFDGQRKRTICGTPNYLAPEILKSSGHSYEVDMWSSGVILYTMIVGTPPFETSDVQATYKRIQNNLYKFPSSIHISDVAKNFIKKMLHPDPAKRPTVTQALLDDFFTNQDYCALPPTQCPETLFDVAAELSGSSSLKRRRMLPTSTQPTSLRKPSTNNIGVAPLSRLPLRPIQQNVLNNKAQIPVSDTQGLTTKRSTAASVKVSLRPNTMASSNPSIQKQPHLRKYPSPPATSRVSSKKIEDNEEDGKNQKEAELNDKTTDKKSTDAQYEHHYLPIQADPNRMSECSVEPDERADEEPAKQEGKMDVTTEEQKDLTEIHEKIEKSFINHNERQKGSAITSSELDPTVSQDLPQFILRVIAWQDFSQDYGLAYRLSNGLCGAFFNDHTKIVYNHQAGNVDYVLARKDREGIYDEAIGFSNIEKIYPKDLTKKMLLIKYFKHCLDKNFGESPIIASHLIDNSRSAPANYDKKLNYYEGAYGSDKPYLYPYVKRWIKTNSAIVFRLTDRTVQVVFKDKTEIILHNEARVVTYVDKEQRLHTKSLEDPELHSMPEAAKRLQYTMGIIQEMIPQNKNVQWTVQK